jgi:sarcosine oxidase subunit beta
VRLSQRSLAFWLALRAEIDLHQHGYLYLADSAERRDALWARAEVQRAWAVPVEALTTAEIAARWPDLRVDDVVGGVYCSADGYAHPYLAAQVLADRLLSLGVDVLSHEALMGATSRGRVVRTIQTAERELPVEHVIIAAGPQSAEVGAWLGVDLPIRPLRRQAVVTTPCAHIPRNLPLTIDAQTGFHFRPDGEALTLAGAGGEKPGDRDFAADPALTERLLTQAGHRLPALQARGPVTAAAVRTGHYDLTPDARPLIGRGVERDNVWCACGFSGHGFMHAPATGQSLAALLADQQPPVDLAPYQPSRFTGPELSWGASVL